MNLCDIQTIRAVLGRHGFHFSRSLGQNFLTDESVPRRIAEMSGAAEAKNVVEVGPGMGCLTAELCRRAEKVVAVELDRALLPVLDETLAEFDNFEVVQGDVLALDLAALCRDKFGDGRAVACANLPYYITTPAITALLESGAFEQVTVMVQKEVAQRICAAPGTAAYSAFTIYVQYHAAAEILFDVPADCFIPRPKVDSAVLRLRPLAEPAVTKSCFSRSCARRSTCAARRWSTRSGRCSAARWARRRSPSSCSRSAWTRACAASGSASRTLRGWRMRPRNS